MVDTTLALTLIVLAVIGAISAVLALRYPFSFRIAVRNIRRARGRTVLVVLGLLVGTAIVSGSLVMGDTIRTLNVHYSYLTWGYTDEGIFGVDARGGNLYFSETLADQIVTASTPNPQIAGMTPEIVDYVQVFDHTTGLPQTNLHLVGADANRTLALGPFTTTAGATSYGPTSGQVFLDQLAANDLNASAGDHLTLYGATTLAVTVEAVVLDDLRGGVLTAGIVGGSVFTDLPTAQQVMNASGLVNVIAVTNVGSQTEGVTYSSSVSSHLNATLAAIPGTGALTVHNLLQESVGNSEAASAGTQTIFLVFGLFSIAAGAMLIVAIFAMLADERKGETGMLRAIGFTQRDVVFSYYFEGVAYSAGSALLGTAVGVGAGYALLGLYTFFVPNSVVGTDVILGSFTATESTLIVSYLVGFLLTLATVLIASSRVSRLNIVRAIRDTPEPPPPIRTYTYLAYLGAVEAVLGALLFAGTVRGSGDISYPVLGLSLVILGAGLIASRFARNRPVFSAVGVALLVWCGSVWVHRSVVGDAHTGGVFFLFVEGILMIAGALLVLAFNAPALVRGLERLVAGRSGATPVTRIGFAYPARRATRTSMTLAIFALVLFTIVFLSTYSATLTGNLNSSLTAQSGGYTFYAGTAQPVPDLAGSVRANSTLSPMFSVLVPLVTGVGSLDLPKATGPPYLDQVYSAPSNATGSSSFYSTSQFPFGATLNGMSDSEALTQLATGTDVAVLDGNYASGGGFAGPPHPVVSVGSVIEVHNPGTGAARNVTVIGILKESILPGIWLDPATASALGFATVNGYLLTVTPGLSVTLAAQKVKAAFYQYGLSVLVFADALASTTTLISGEIGLLEVFIALGLAVGIAALGILALRAVTERRREIGVLRAIGLTRMMVLKAFLVEYTFVTLTGAAIGGLLGLLVVYNLTTGPGAADAGVSTLYVPWLSLIGVVALTGALATLAVIGPSARAARLPPAEALRTIG